ncbi:MAG: dihydrolipoyl dehydrogenase [Acidobacteriota bacterium]
MSSKQFDLIVLGSGPGGYVAAIRGAQLGLSVAVVEKDPKYGGTCLHRGCIPTKALLHTAELLDEIRRAKTFGISVPAPELDLPGAHRHKDKIVAKNARGIEYLLKKNSITGIHGFGRLTGPHEVTVDADGESTAYGARHVLLATGSVPRELPFAPADGERILNSDHILQLQEVPESLVVLGAGAVGTEFASIYRAFGSKVTLVEMLPRVLPLEDEEISKGLGKILKKKGIDVRADTKLAKVETTESGLALTLEGPKKTETLQVAKLLVAVGRAPVSGNIGLDSVGVAVDQRGYVEVDEYMRTSVPHIYAIGDVVNTPWLAHVASSEGILAAEHIAGEAARPLDYNKVPACTYCDPEVASVGLTEAQAKEQGYAVATGKFPLTALGKAAILGKTEGFVKVVRDTQYDELLGVHIVGARATDLIAEACVALQVESTNEELLRTIHAHPTLSEAVAEAAHAAHGAPIHI